MRSITAGIFLLAATGAAASGHGTGTAQIHVTPPGIAITEVSPYQMTLERKPGTAPTDGFSLKEWTQHLAINPEDTVQPGCLRISGDMNKTVGIVITAISDIAAPGGAKLTVSGSPRLDIGISGADCAEAIAASKQSVGLNAAPITASTSASGELFISWQYRQPASGTTGYMILSDWEEGVFTGTVDFQIDYQ